MVQCHSQKSKLEPKGNYLGAVVRSEPDKVSAKVLTVWPLQYDKP